MLAKRLLLLPFLVLSLALHAQDFSTGNITLTDRQLQKNQLDSLSNAAILNEYGEAMFVVNESKGELDIVFYHHVKAKIFNKDGVSAANIVIPAYQNGYHSDEVSDVKGKTYNFINGRQSETELDRKNIYEEDYNKNVKLTKFTLPNVQDGAIIEYSYRVSSPRLFNFHPWDFQSDIPKLHSGFRAVIPAAYNYNVSLRGGLSLKNTKSELMKDGFSLAGWRMDCSDMYYEMDSIPAFIEEEYMTAASNFRSAIQFELSDVYNRQGNHESYTQKWGDVDRQLRLEKNFGSQIKNKDFFKKILPPVIEGKNEPLLKANAVYEFIRKQIKWNNFNGLFTETTIEDALKKHKGNAADINLALVAALNAVDISAEAVMLSTRNNGVANKLYPIISDFNYVVALAHIGENNYWLDATDPDLAFGMLPMRCLNDSGRVFPLRKASYWTPLNTNQVKKTQYFLNGKLNNNGKLSGSLVIRSNSYDAYSKRKEIHTYPTVEEYVEKKAERMPRTKIGNYTITGADTTNQDILETYEVEMSLFDSLNFSRLYFNPFLISKTDKNPFRLNERNYPVDFGMPGSEEININISLPPDFVLESKPDNIAMVIPGKTAGFRSLYQVTEGRLQCNYRSFFDQPVYWPEDYLNLKELYSRIIQVEKKDIILKKQ